MDATERPPKDRCARSSGSVAVRSTRPTPSDRRAKTPPKTCCFRQRLKQKPYRTQQRTPERGARRGRRRRAAGGRRWILRLSPAMAHILRSVLYPPEGHHTTSIPLTDMLQARALSRLLGAGGVQIWRTAATATGRSTRDTECCGIPLCSSITTPRTTIQLLRY
jgi:hypothetical protein